MGDAEIGRFLSSLATDSHVSASTQNQALNALLFLYREVLRKDIGYVNGVVRAKKTEQVTDCADTAGSQVYSRPPRRLRLDHGHVALWSRPPTDGMPAVESQVTSISPAIKSLSGPVRVIRTTTQCFPQQSKNRSPSTLT